MTNAHVGIVSGAEQMLVVKLTSLECRPILVTNFYPPYLQLMPQFGVTSFEFCRDLWH